MVCAGDHPAAPNDRRELDERAGIDVPARGVRQRHVECGVGSRGFRGVSKRRPCRGARACRRYCRRDEPLGGPAHGALVEPTGDERPRDDREGDDQYPCDRQHDVAPPVCRALSVGTSGCIHGVGVGSRSRYCRGVLVRIGMASASSIPGSGWCPYDESRPASGSAARAAGLPRQMNVAIRPNRNPISPASTMDWRRFGAVFDDVALYACARICGASVARTWASASCALAALVCAVPNNCVSVASATASPGFDDPPACSAAMRADSWCCWTSACAAWLVRVRSTCTTCVLVDWTSWLANPLAMLMAVFAWAFEAAMITIVATRGRGRG